MTPNDLCDVVAAASLLLPFPSCRLEHVVILNISRNKLTLLEALPPHLQVLNVSKVRGWGNCLRFYLLRHDMMCLNGTRMCP